MKSRQGKWHKLIGHPLFLYSVAFCVVAIIGYTFPLFLKGKTIIWEVDGIGQYYAAFLYIGEYIRRLFSAGMPAYDLSIALGENIVGSLNYYGFGDPINLIAVFATKSNGHIVFSIAFFLRLYLAGLSMLHYLNSINLKSSARIAAVIAYLFSGFTIFGCAYYIEWLSALILLPLILAEAERFINGRKNYITFSLVVCYGALCGFYFLYMSSLALAVYCVVRIAATHGKLNIKALFSNCIKLLGVYLLGIGLSAPVLFQALDAFLFSERNSRVLDIIMNINSYIPSIKALVVFCFRSIVPKISTYNLGITAFHWLAVFYILINAIKHRKGRDIQLVVGVMLSIIAVALPITGYLFNAFSETNTRWYFLIHFLAAVILATMLEDMHAKNLLKANFCKAACFLVCLNVIANILFVYSGRGLNLANEFIAASDVSKYITTPATNSIAITNDNSLYRIDHDLYTDINGRPDNIAMLNGYNGLSYWFSIVNYNSQKYIDWTSGKNLSWRSFGLGTNAYTSALAGVKYYLSKDSKVSEFYTLIERVKLGNETWNVYENSLYKGLVYECKKAYSYDPAAYKSFEDYNKQLYAKTNAANISNINYDSNTSELTFTSNIAEDKSKIIIAIPYNHSWNVKIDGENATTSPFNGMTIIEISAGSHLVQISYIPLARNIGIAVSLISIALLLSTVYARRCRIGNLGLYFF